MESQSILKIKILEKEFTQNVLYLILLFYKIKVNNDKVVFFFFL